MINFTKMHALGNDFVIIDQILDPVALTKEQICLISNRKYGVGCDQVLTISAKTSGDHDFVYRIFNNDGTEVAHCGNGARAVIAYLYQFHDIKLDEIRLKTLNRIISGYRVASGIKITMGVPSFMPNNIPSTLTYNEHNHYTIKHLDEDINFAIVSVGNPHAIIVLSTLTKLQPTNHLEKIAQTLQAADCFPEGINVNFVVINNQKQIHLLTYERGCGFTESCGTGAVASVAYLVNAKLLHEEVEVVTIGGKLQVNIEGNLSSYLSGPTTIVFKGQIWL